MLLVLLWTAVAWIRWCAESALNLHNVKKSMEPWEELLVVTQSCWIWVAGRVGDRGDSDSDQSVANTPGQKTSGALFQIIDNVI